VGVGGTRSDALTSAMNPTKIKLEIRPFSIPIMVLLGEDETILPFSLNLPVEILNPLERLHIAHLAQIPLSGG
jgi:hypothetical protein